MYELFMTAFINDIDFDRARSLLSGYCWSEPNTRFYRVIHYDGPNPPKPITKTSNIRGIPPQPDPFMYGLPGAEPLQPQVGPYIDPDWRALSDILKKQSYISHPLNARQGALFWAEIPDPASTAGGQSLILQRNKIEIWDQLNLPAVMADNGFRPKAETVEETHDIYHRDDPMLEFNLVRHYKLPSPKNPSAPEKSSPLPDLDQLEKTDPAGKWILWARVHVLSDDKAPEKIKAARDTLARVRDELRGTGIEFRELDRRVHDTQLAGSGSQAWSTLSEEDEEEEEEMEMEDLQLTLDDWRSSRVRRSRRLAREKREERERERGRECARGTGQIGEGINKGGPGPRDDYAADSGSVAKVGAQEFPEK
ncbi:hypothetical protein VP1G_06623 [Cytospora mali]|uniref:Mediator of RNA polymerase II transcription subunit 18 n=1 Tax=Cytospora mali TaxID=578113 RepID=A0A194V668_CYTMA|nr:hypothetical protein VP1G_06623 [Valsa mali var. pyri (nom. inval.)]